MTTYINLTHPLSSKTPAYAGGQGLVITPLKSMACSDSCNQVEMTMSNHIGTHVDAPFHFIAEGKTITDYAPEDWVFQKPTLLKLPCQPGQVINSAVLESAELDQSCDLLMINTGFEQYRGDAIYWQQSPVFHDDLGAYFEKNFGSLKAIAFDCISLSSLTDRERGRQAHREILGRGIRIFEDVKLSILSCTPDEVLAFPLWLEQGDGAQVTMMARVNN